MVTGRVIIRLIHSALEHLSDETLRLLEENDRQLKEGSGVVVGIGRQLLSRSDENTSSSSDTDWNPCSCLFYCCPHPRQKGSIIENRFSTRVKCCNANRFRVSRSRSVI